MGERIFEQAVLGWRDAGITSDLIQRYADSALSADEYAAQLAQENATAYENVFFTANWESRPDIVAFVNEAQEQNYQNIYLAIRTADDEMPFEWAVDTHRINVTTDSANQRDLDIFYHEFNNGTQNTAVNIDPSILDEIAQNRRTGVKMLQYGDVMKITAITKIKTP